MAERCLELMVARVTSRTAFGKLLAQQGSILQDIALSRTEIEQSRLLTLKAAHMCVLAYMPSASRSVALR
jgi:acyl-CoA dehydrogenase family protein 10